MRSGPYDLALVPDDNRYAWLARAAGARWIVGFANDRPAWKNWMLDEAMTYPTEPAAWADMALALAHSESVPAYRVGEWPAPLPGRGHEQLARLGTRYAVLHVGASTPLKLWPAERWRLLADELRRRHCEIVWSAGAGEDEVLKAVGVRPGEHNLVGTLDLGSLWALLAGAQLLVCPDTGIAHLARVVGVPTIALFGPGSAIVHGPGRFWKDAPYWVVTDASYPCRDQTVLYRRDIAWVARCGRGFGPAPGQCPRAGCMEVLAFDAVKDLLESACALPR
jgi:ADP-heptose:LPS heptosyltransferase